MPRSSTPVSRPLLAPTESVDVAFRQDKTVGPTMSLVSRLHHAAYMLAVYASPCGSPLHGARLASRSWARRYRDRTFTCWVPYSNFQVVSGTSFPNGQTFLAHYPFNAGPLEYAHYYSRCPEGPFLAALTSGYCVWLSNIIRKILG